jgi:hypothetical protein
MAEPEPTRRQIAKEALLYALLVLGAGAVFVAFRIAKDGPQVLDVSPHRR